MRRWIPLIVGAIGPIVMLVLDPIVFHVGPMFDLGTAHLGALRAFGYVATVLAAVLVTRAALKETISATESGMLYGAALVSLLLGLAILPLSIMGLLMFGIGLLGLWPFAASWVYFKQARRNRPALLGVLLFLAVPLSLQIGTNSTVDWAVSHVDTSAAGALLRVASPLYDADQLALRFQQSTDPAQRRQLALAFRLMSGRTVEDRLAMIGD